MATSPAADSPRAGERRAEERPERDYQRGGRTRFRELASDLGPGLITGAADDDPSGIATYSQAGAAYGYGLLWMALVSLPLMVSVQVMCARVGIVTQGGLAAVLREHYARSLLWFACALLLVANTVNIAADLGGMAAAVQLLTGLPAVWFVPAFALIILALLVYASYRVMTRVLKWLTLALFAYVIAAFLAHPHVMEVARGTVMPRITWSRDYLTTVVAILGTTISPYLFFWQAAQNAEQDDHHARGSNDRPRRAVQRELRSARRDVIMGMSFSNAIMYFIILTTGATLHPAGITIVETAQQAAQALRPLSGVAASTLFAAGLIGTGMLGVPVLAGSAAYAVAEAASWRRGMDEKMGRARNFYGVIAVAMLLGVALNFTTINPIRFLFWSAVLNGLLAPPLIVIILVVCNNAKVMGSHRNRWPLNLLGGLTAVAMTAAAAGLVISML